MSTDKGVKVSVLKYHTFRGKEYNPGDSYTVTGDQGQTGAQYVDTLRATGLARPSDEEGTGPNIVDEVSGVDDNDPKAKSAVAPLTTENFQTAEVMEQPAEAPKAAKAPRAAKAKQPAASGGKKK